MSSHSRTFVVVDRVENGRAVMEGDDGRIFRVAASRLKPAPREGMVYAVALGEAGAPRWTTAVEDRAEADRRLKDLGDRMARRRSRDGGGDIDL